VERKNRPARVPSGGDGLTKVALIRSFPGAVLPLGSGIGLIRISAVDTNGEGARSVHFLFDSLAGRRQNAAIPGRYPGEARMAFTTKTRYGAMPYWFRAA